MPNWGDHRLRILFVDDDPAILRALRRALTPDTGRWDMTFVVGGASGLAALDAQPFDVLVTDLEMPDIDGRVLVERARSRKVICFLHTGSKIDDAGVGVRAILRKPCQPAILRAALVGCEIR